MPKFGDLPLKFLEISDSYKLAEFFGLKLETLTYLLYKLTSPEKYKEFHLQKRSGSTRRIFAPISPIKTLQRKLKDELDEIYTPKINVHGYVKGRSIKTNAFRHDSKLWVARMDLDSFFPSINFGRVRGMFLKEPLNFTERVATLLAKLCIMDNELPQGAPTSPVISNIICRRLDRELLALAISLRCVYTRYADDITISTTRKTFPTSMCYLDHSDNKLQAKVGSGVRDIIESNGFRVNEDKTYLCNKSGRQIVTGIVVNRHLNVRRRYVDEVRAMLHCWDKYGFKSTEHRFITIYDKKNRPFSEDGVKFRLVLLGRIQYIGSIKGWDDPVYLNLSSRFSVLDARDKIVANPFEYNKKKLVRKSSLKVHVFCEGRSDIKHLQAALNYFQELGEFSDLPIDFEDSRLISGSVELLKKCKELAKEQQENVKICIFDRDEPDKIKEATDSTGDVKDWGRNVFSFAIEVPIHRERDQKICIEHLYSDKDLKKTDKNGRRLYFRDEFFSHNGFHKTEKVFFLNPKRKTQVIDSDVIDKETGNSVALSKDKLAEYILNKEKPFDKVDFAGFQRIFEIIKKIREKVLSTPN